MFNFRPEQIAPGATPKPDRSVIRTTRSEEIKRLRPSAPSRTMSQSFVLNLDHGLHARPCALLVKTLRPFRCKVEVHANGHQANGHSIMGLMALAAADRTKMSFLLTGEDAPEALAAISHLFETRFEDAYIQRLKATA
jgi:phosphocarrier protein HPr